MKIRARHSARFPLRVGPASQHCFAVESSSADIDTKINQRNANNGISPINGNAETKSNLDIINAAAINLPISFENIRSTPELGNCIAAN